MKGIVVNRIRERRRELGWTLEQLGDRIGVSPQRISDWEQHRKTPTLYWALRLSKALGMHPDDLFQIEDA